MAQGNEKDYVVVHTEILDILGHKVKAVNEDFSYAYLNSKRFEPRCLRCCFHGLKRKHSICNYLKCTGYCTTNQTHFELIG